MYGKSYESMYEGSMIGAGINVFAVWNYIITKARGGSVEVNPKLLAFTLGGTQQQVLDALDFLQKPDPISRSKLEEGRRLIKEGQFQYRIVNWAHYQVIKNAADKREYNRTKQAEYRAASQKKKPPKSSGRGAADAHEPTALKALENGDESAFDAAVTASLPEGCR